MSLLKKEAHIEWRNKFAINGIILYIASSIFICYLSFQFGQVISPIVWNALYWIIMLFAATNAIFKSFFQENAERNYYYHFLACSEAIILAKIIYNILLMMVLSILGFVLFSIVMGNPVADIPQFIVVLFLGAIGFASALTMVAAITYKSGNNSVLMAVLSFPVVVPILLTLIKASKNAMDGLDWSMNGGEILTLLAINMIIITLTLLMFPYLWRS